MANFEMSSGNSNSQVLQAIKKAMMDFNRGQRAINLNDLMTAEQIERELENQGLLKPKGCKCGQHERRS